MCSAQTLPCFLLQSAQPHSSRCPRSAHGLPLVASSPRDAPHRVGPCFSAGGSQVGPAALWRPSNVGLTNPKTGKVGHEGDWVVNQRCRARANTLKMGGGPKRCCLARGLAPERPNAHPAAPLTRSPAAPLTRPPNTPQRLGFAVVELFAVSSESLKRLERAAADQYGTALAQVG